MIAIHKSSYPDGWYAICHGVRGMPDGVHTPLSFTCAASVHDVTLDIRRRFPGERVFVAVDGETFPMQKPPAP